MIDVALGAGTNPHPGAVEAHVRSVRAPAPENGMSFLLYIVGFIVFIAGLAWLATALGVSQTYLLIGAGVLLGIGLLTAAARSRAA